MQRSAVKLIREYNQDRHPEILKFKYKAMAESPFRFLRGSCHLFYHDYSKNPAVKDDTTSVWLCGDMHIENFGAYQGDNGLAYFDINDFDESTRAPLTWDLARFLVSLQLSTASIGVDLKEIHVLSKIFMTAFHKILLAGKSKTVEAPTSTGVIKSFFNQVSERSRKKFVEEKTILVKGKIQLLKSKDHWLLLNKETHQRVMRSIDSWNNALKEEDRYKLIDIAYRLAGTGSMGLERYVVLAKKDSAYYFLDFKYAQQASIDLYVKPHIRWENDAQRIIGVQQMSQHVSPALLQHVIIDGVNFVLRELQPLEDKLDFSILDAKKGKLNEVIRTMAEMAASSYLRSSGWMKASTIDDLISFSAHDDWHKDLYGFATTYKNQVMDDFNEFTRAFKNKELIHEQDMESIIS